jgi:hypothetical protein
MKLPLNHYVNLFAFACSLLKVLMHVFKKLAHELFRKRNFEAIHFLNLITTNFTISNPIQLPTDLNSWACTWKVFWKVLCLCTPTPNSFFHLYSLFSKFSTMYKYSPSNSNHGRHLTILAHTISIKEHEPNQTNFPLKNSSNTSTIWNNHNFKLHSWINSIQPASSSRPDEHTSMHLFKQHCTKKF